MKSRKNRIFLFHIGQQEKFSEFKEYIENDEVNQLYFLDIDIHGIEKKGF